jgi:act minimal PKS acyl carrier protein
MAANEFTIDDLRRVLRESAGDAEEQAVSLDSDILDVSFTDLGYDSLALLETGRRIELEHGIELADSMVTDAETPRSLLVFVNDGLGSTAPL